MPIAPNRDGSTAGPESIGARLRGLIVPAILVIGAFAVLISLGNWQVRRLAWKEDLVARVAERPNGSPVDLRGLNLSAVGDESFLDANEFRPALVVGEYDRAGEVLVFTSLSNPNGASSGPGYWVLTPLVTPVEGSVVYVNRGFVPEASKRGYAPPPEGRVTARGLIRSAEKGSWFTPEPNLAERIFFARDPRRIAAATGLPGEVAGFFIDLPASETPPVGLPQAGETRMTFTNNHLGYAVTWYGLAAALLAVFASFVWSRLRDGSQDQRLTRPRRNP